MNLLNAPDRGIVYALYTDRVVFDFFQKENLPDMDALQKNLLELHLFDNRKEYRVVNSKRGEIELCISDDSFAPDTEIYTEKVNTSSEKIPWIEVINYLTYDENDLMVINNFRLREVAE